MLKRHKLPLKRRLLDPSATKEMALLQHRWE